MSKYINAAELIKTIQELKDGTKEWDEGIQIGLNSAIHLVENYPSADVVEVVRCKDCECWKKTSEDSDGYIYGVCRFHTDCSMTYYNDFCSYGERKGTDDRPNQTND